MAWRPAATHKLPSSESLIHLMAHYPDPEFRPFITQQLRCRAHGVGMVLIDNCRPLRNPFAS
eukprot:1109672-Rhodomonas_salina.2